jgi:hypothetical protein
MKRARVRPVSYTYKGKTEQRWLVEWYDLKHVRREKRFKTKREADLYAIQIDKELADMSHVSDRGAMTFAQVAEKYLGWIEGRPDLTGGTKYAYRYEVRKHLIPHFGRPAPCSRRTLSLLGKSPGGHACPAQSIGQAVVNESTATRLVTSGDARCRSHQTGTRDRRSAQLRGAPQV